MFDIGSAVVLGLVLTGLVAMAHTLVLGPNTDRIKVGVCLVVSIITVLLVAASDFAKDQVLLNRHLNALNFWSQMVIALLLAGLASALWQGFKAVSNIGIPMPKYPTAKANGKQPLAGTGLTGATSSDLASLLTLPAESGYPGNVAPTVADVEALTAPKPVAKKAPAKKTV